MQCSLTVEQIFQWLDDSATCTDALNVEKATTVGILMVGHLEGKRKWVHFKFLSYQTSIHIPLSDGPTRSMLVIYWTNKKKVKKANNQTNSSVFCSNAVISKFTSSVLPENNNEGKLSQSLPIKLKRTSHTKYAVKRNRGVLTLTFEREAETQVPQRKASGVAQNSGSIEVNKKFPVRVGVSILPLLAVTLLNEAYMR